MRTLFRKIIRFLKKVAERTTFYRNGNIGRITIFNIYKNKSNGTVIKLLDLDVVKPMIDASLIGVNYSKEFFYFDILFFTIKVYQIEMK